MKIVVVLSNTLIIPYPKTQVTYEIYCMLSDINFFQLLHNSDDLSDYFSDKTQYKIIIMFSSLKGMVMLLLVLGETLLMK